DVDVPWLTIPLPEPADLEDRMAMRRSSVHKGERELTLAGVIRRSPRLGGRYLEIFASPAHMPAADAQADLFDHAERPADWRPRADVVEDPARWASGYDDPRSGGCDHNDRSAPWRTSEG